ncbi:MAG: hypothetical protein LC798_19635 [Chloroflexi bacterium]|nr:hypothetical protein [Chloroflexota bacterium]
MKPGRRWIVLDAYYLGSPLAITLRRQFGAMGPLMFIAFLCACKRARPPGTFTYMTEPEALDNLGVDERWMVDNEGKPWTLDDFWTATGRMKHTKRTRRGHVMHVVCTHWERWQEDPGTVAARERKRRSRAKTVTLPVTPQSQPCHAMSRPDSDSDSDISPPTPSYDRSRGDTPRPPDQHRGDGSTNGKTKDDDPTVAWLRKCVPGTGHAAATQAVARLRARGVGDKVIEEAAGYAAAHDGHSASFVEKVAEDWMGQRDPSWPR